MQSRRPQPPAPPSPAAPPLALLLLLLLALALQGAAAPAGPRGPGGAGGRRDAGPPRGLLQQAARAALHFLNFRAGSPSALRALAAVQEGRARINAEKECTVDLVFTTERHNPEQGEERLGKCSARVFFRNQKPRPAINITCTRFMEKNKRQQEDYLLYKQMKQLRNPLDVVSIPGQELMAVVPARVSNEPRPPRDSADAKQSAFVQHSTECGQQPRPGTQQQIQFPKPQQSSLDLRIAGPKTTQQEKPTGFLHVFKKNDRDAATTLISFTANDQRRTKTFGRLAKPITLTVDSNQKLYLAEQIEACQSSYDVETDMNKSRVQLKVLLRDDPCDQAHGHIDPSLRPIWDLAFLGSSYVMWEKTTQFLHYYMAQLSSVKQWKTNDGTIDFDYTVLLHEFSTQEIIPCRIHLVWSPGKPLKVKYHCQGLQAPEEASGTEEGSAVAPTELSNF